MRLLNKIKMMWGKRHTKVYISGKISGLPTHLWQYNFIQAEKDLRTVGYTRIVNPYRLSKQIAKKLRTPIDEIGYEVFLSKDLEELCKCNLVVLQNNWLESDGALLENYIASRLKIKTTKLTDIILGRV
jgi:hypothetical protein